MKRIKLFLCMVTIVASLFISGCSKSTKESTDQSIDSGWGDMYYVFLNNVVENNKYEEAGLPENSKKVEMSFIENEKDKNPEMVLSYEKDKKTYSNIYYIQDDEVNVETLEQPSSVKLLYNLNKNETNYYLVVPDEEKSEEKFVTISEELLEKDSIQYEYTLSTKEKKYADSNGNSTKMSDVDRMFMEIPMETKEVTLDTDSLFDQMNEAVNDYKPIEKIVDEEQEKRIEDFKNQLDGKETQEESKQETTKDTTKVDVSSMELLYQYTSADNLAMNGKPIILNIYEMNDSQITFSLEDKAYSNLTYTGVAKKSGSSYVYSVTEGGPYSKLEFSISSDKESVTYNAKGDSNVSKNLFGGPVEQTEQETVQEEVQTPTQTTPDTANTTESFVTGSHSVAYGYYYDSTNGESLTLNKDLTFTYTDHNNTTYTGTFATDQVGNGIGPGASTHDGIVLNCSDGTKVYWMVDTDNVLYDQWHSLICQN